MAVPEVFPNNASTFMTGAGITTATQNTVPVLSAALFGAAGQYRILIDNEIMLVTSGQGTTTWGITRGVDGTTAATHTNLLSPVTAIITRDGLANMGPSGSFSSLQPSGKLGAQAASSLAGGTINGAPTTGTFAVGDLVVDQAGRVWVCTVAPLTFIQANTTRATGFPVAAGVAGDLSSDLGNGNIYMYNGSTWLSVDNIGVYGSSGAIVGSAVVTAAAGGRFQIITGSLVVPILNAFGGFVVTFPVPFPNNLISCVMNPGDTPTAFINQGPTASRSLSATLGTAFILNGANPNFTLQYPPFPSNVRVEFVAIGQ